MTLVYTLFVSADQWKFVWVLRGVSCADLYSDTGHKMSYYAQKATILYMFWLCVKVLVKNTETGQRIKNKYNLHGIGNYYIHIYGAHRNYLTMHLTLFLEWYVTQ